MRCLAVIPAFREERHIADVVRRTLAVLPDVLVVDDGSPDGTAAAAEAAGARVVRHPVNQGKGVALQTGFARARADGFDAVITLDADGQHDPAEIPGFLRAAAETGADVVVGSRMQDVKDMPWIRRLTNWFMSWLLSREMGQWVPDTQCGYRMFRCAVLDGIEVGSARFAAESEILLMLAARGCRIASAPIRTIYGDEKSKIHPARDTVRFFAMLRRFRRTRRAGR